MKKAIIFGAALAAFLPLAVFALPLPYWGTNPPLLPCTGIKCVSVCQMVELGQNVIWLAISVAVFAIAPILIAIGGILVLTAGGSTERMKRGKGVIIKGLIGMALALGAFMIVNTFFVLMGITFGGGKIEWADISCSQGEFPFPAGGAGITAPPEGPPPPGRAPIAGTGWSGATPPPGTLTDSEARSQLAAVDIEVESSNRSNGDCTFAGQTNCTSLMGIPQQAIDGVIEIKENCDCSVTVTAGTEAGHDTHGMGQSILDVRIDRGVNNYIREQIGTRNPVPDRYYAGSDGNRYRYEVDHWHVEF